jgi:type IV secretory pathway VirB2 component (pilin)
MKHTELTPASRLHRRLRVPRAFVLLIALAICVAPVFAQVGGGTSPFDSTLNALLTFAQGTFAKIAAILAVIFGGWQVVGGDGQGKRAIGGLVIGVGLMVYAAPLITWLFP